MAPSLRRHILCVVLTLVLFTPPGAAQVITGTVRDAETAEMLPAATIRVVGTDSGTIANADGRFRLSLAAGRHRLAVSFVGYRSDTLIVQVPGAVFLDVRLVGSPVRMPEVVVSGEDPAVAIMRKVIERKKEWLGSLASYSFEAFTRTVFRKDTAIVSIMESYTSGYWKQGDTLREVIRQKRQTQNIPEQTNLTSVGKVLNFYDDEIDLGGYRFIGPTNPDAFDVYDFRLEATKESDGRTVYLISLNPSSRTVPLFKGTIHVVDGRYVLASIDVWPNEAFSIPLITDFQVRFQQQFAPIRGRFWLPVDVRASAEVKISLLLFSMPRMRFESVSSIYAYDVNAVVPDTLFTKGRRIFQDSTASTVDSAFWAERDVLPLTVEQRLAFDSIDSTETLEKVFRPESPLGDIGGDETSVLDYLDARYTRVEGVYLGGKLSVDSLLGAGEVRAFAGYGFADRRPQAGLSALWRIVKGTYAIGASGYTKLSTIHDERKHVRIENSLDALLFRNDYFDYYRTTGGEVFVRRNWGERTRLEVGARAEEHRSVSNATDFAVFRLQAFRPNPAVRDGSLRSITAGFSYTAARFLPGLIAGNALDMSAEVSDAKLGSDFDFVRIAARGSYRWNTILQRSAFPAYATLSVSAGTAFGDPPPQRHFAPETQSSAVAPMGVLRGARVKEFAGKQFFLLSLEHNFRNAPFLLLGIPFIYEQGLEFVAFGTVARTASPGGASPLGASTRGVYGEMGVGINHLFKLFRADVTYRLSSPSGVSVTLSIAQIL